MKVPKPDVVIATSPPFGIGMVGYLLSRRWGAKLIFEVRDLFPQSAISFGVLRNSFLIRCLKGVERFYYEKADRVVGVTQGICDFIRHLGIPQGKIKKITNGVNLDIFRRLPSSDFHIENNLENHFVVMYTGIHGRAENLSVLIEAAKILKREDYIRFVLVGDGVEKKSLIALKNKYALPNIIFLDTQPADRMPHVLASADVCFSSRKNVDVNCGALPVKIFEYMACEKPVVLSIKGEAETLVRESHAGVCVNPEDPIALANAIIELSKDKASLKRYGIKGRDYVSRFFDRKVLADDYLSLMTDTLAE